LKSAELQGLVEISHWVAGEWTRYHPPFVDALKQAIKDKNYDLVRETWNGASSMCVYLDVLSLLNETNYTPDMQW